MKLTILCINGSDSSGRAGIQSDIRTATELGVGAQTAVTSVTVQNAYGIKQIHDLPAELVVGQVRSAYEEQAPAAVKIGMVNDAETIGLLKRELVACRSIVCSPSILAGGGGCLMSNESLHAFVHDLLPLTRLLILKCTDAEIMLGKRIVSDEDMMMACNHFHSLGAQWVMMRGGTFVRGMVNAMVSGEGERRFFSSGNVEGWRQHGVGGALSTAITARLAMGDDVPTAIHNAHTYLHAKVVYGVEDRSAQRPTELYNRFLSLISEYHGQAHDVLFYASRLSIGTRYLAQITNHAVGKSPKQVIDEYLLSQMEQLLLTSSMSIQQIADRVGFASQVTATRFFHAKKGLSPTSFRKGTRH